MVPRTSDVVRLTIDGDIEGLKALFAMKQASPFDQTDEPGCTLLHVCLNLIIYRECVRVAKSSASSTPFGAALRGMR